MQNLINVDHFKTTYYKAFLPLEKINEFLNLFSEKEVETVTKVLISIFDTTVTRTMLQNLKSIEQKQEFLRLINNRENSETIIDFLIDSFPSSETLISETLERTVLSANSVIK